MSTIFDRPQIGFRFVEIQYNDTLQLLALRHLGNASRWPELIAYNSLIPPYIVDDPALKRDGVLAAGDLLLVPAAAEASVQGNAPEDVLRSDVMLYKGQFLFENGDFKIVSGVDNLKQGLRHAIETDRGDLMFHPEYGSLVRQLIGAVNGPTAGILAAGYAKAPVQADDRIVNVTSATATMEGDVIRVSIEAETVLGKLVGIAATV